MSQDVVNGPPAPSQVSKAEVLTKAVPSLLEELTGSGLDAGADSIHTRLVGEESCIPSSAAPTPAPRSSP